MGRGTNTLPKQVLGFCLPHQFIGKKEKEEKKQLKKRKKHGQHEKYEERKKEKNRRIKLNECCDSKPRMTLLQKT